MVLPAVGSEANFLNPMYDVLRFFERYHRGQFLIFNVCSERNYDPGYFGGRVVRIPVRLDKYRARENGRETCDHI
jgi:hypothetical protein